MSNDQLNFDSLTATDSYNAQEIFLVTVWKLLKFTPTLVWQKFRENDFIIKKLLTYPQCGKVLSKHYHAEKNSVKSHNKNLQNLSLLDNG